MKGGVTEMDNVLLGLCCSKNSTTNKRRTKGFIYRSISQIDFISSSNGCPASIAALI